MCRDGYPPVFYPDLNGAEYGDNTFHINLDPVPNIGKLILARKQYAYGNQQDYFDERNAIGWIREGDEAYIGSGLGVLLTNGPDAIKWMKIGEKFAGKTLHDFLENINETITVNEEGWAPFRVNGGSVSVWVFQNYVFYNTLRFSDKSVLCMHF